MVSPITMRGDEGRLATVLEALRRSLAATRKYIFGSMAFYLVLVTVFAILVATVKDPEARGADLGILILVSLGLLGLWISALRGLHGRKINPAVFLNLFRLPLTEDLRKMEDHDSWDSEEERLRKAVELLEHQAAAEREHRDWPNRLLSLSVITAIDLLIWLAWKNWVMALVNQVIAMIVSQVHISMGPRRAIEALASLEERE
ncbi:hypothetical protein [Candidatus Solincola sp.]|jgi:hypothetical protein|nr:hypothetical protein [Actinomycetota bacterium]MDI7252993.1 hypothetical protein [Actinomycetota bacterium]